MEKRGTTVLGLSQATGIPRTTLDRKLRARDAFDVDELSLIAGQLGVSVTYLVRVPRAGLERAS